MNLITAIKPGELVTHLFDVPSDYTITLAVTDSKGAVGVAEIHVAVGGGAGVVPDGFSVGGMPLAVGKGSGEQISLSWGDSAACGFVDSDYEIYSGMIGDFTSHIEVLCSTAGATSTTIAGGMGDFYYLVVPTNGVWEGSYGRASDGSERGQGSSACLPQGVAACTTCGNGLLEPAEVCDDPDLAGETCVSLGFDGGVLECGSACDGFNTLGCFLVGCGNGIQEGTEVCDGEDLAGESCSSQGFGSGTLACGVLCDAFDTSGCLP